MAGFRYSRNTLFFAIVVGNFYRITKSVFQTGKFVLHNRDLGCAIFFKMHVQTSKFQKSVVKVNAQFQNDIEIENDSEIENAQFFKRVRA